jgi:hypothetical protein
MSSGRRAFDIDGNVVGVISLSGSSVGHAFAIPYGQKIETAARTGGYPQSASRRSLAGHLLLSF